MPPHIHLLGLCVLLVSPVALMPAATAEAPRATYNFNSDWKLLVGDRAGAEAAGFDDAAWKAVTLPHAWNEDDAFKAGCRGIF